MISAIILSAGESTRFGSPKALAPWKQTTVINHICQVLDSSEVFETIIVLGDQASGIQQSLLKHKTLKVVHNKDHNLGQTSSFQVGLAASNPDAQGVLLWPVDYPAISQDTLKRLYSSFQETPQKIWIPTYKKRKGHPPVIPNIYRKHILQMPVDQGINTLFQQYPDALEYIPVDDPGVRATFNTLEEYNEITGLF